MKEIFYKLKKMNSARILIYLGIALILVGGSSFAYLNFFVEGSETNLVRSGCFETSFEESSALNLTKQVPISDDEGKVLTPYTFTIKNVCELDANYVVSFNTLTTSNEENNEKVKVYLTGDKTIEPTLVSELEEMTFLEVHNGLNKSFLIDEGTLQQNDTKTYELRMWIDYDVTSFTGSFDSKILVSNINEGGFIYDPAKTLTLNLDGGTTTDNLTTELKKGEVITLSVPTKTDYVFAGWNVEGTDLTTTGDTITMGETDATATAKWVKKVNTFAYTGSAPTTPYVAIPGSYKLEVWGAQGGYRSNSTYGGLGGYATGILSVTQNTNLYVYVGGRGGNGTSGCGSTICAGGFNGGGYRYKYYGGGGGTDIRINNTSLYARVIVAGGGGSDGATNKNGMAGGGTTGGSSTQSYTANTNYCGKGGTATYSGYSTSYTVTTQATSGLNSNSLSYYGGGFGFGGGGVYKSSGYGGAGGGGWYGGSGTVPDGSGDDDRGGGGGSGYVYTSSTASQYPSGCLLNSSYYLTSTSMTSGARSGNGTATITVMSINY